MRVIAGAGIKELRKIKTFAARSKAIEMDRVPRRRRSKSGEVGVCLRCFGGAIGSTPEWPLSLCSIDFRDEQRRFL
jgi:hypothetical protein